MQRRFRTTSASRVRWSPTADRSNIVRALDATDNRIVKLDIGRGRSWWVTRLLVLAAGAVRAGAPEMLVFVGMKENEPQAFLGWAPPDKVLAGILDDKCVYRDHYMKARRSPCSLKRSVHQARVHPC